MSTLGACTGVVKWYDSSKGYGFIGRDGGERDIFLHAGSLRRSGIDANSMQEGVELRFDVEAGPKGDKATNISMI